jgi:hypothetical protein
MVECAAPLISCIMRSQVCIGSLRSMLGKEWTFAVLLWPDVWARPVSCSRRWSIRSESMYWQDRRSTPMIRRFRCWLPARAKPRRPGYGPMCGTIVLPATRPQLQGFRGALQADAYSGFHHLYGDGAIYEVACWAHARRKFHDIRLAHASPTTTEALVRIGALYGIEEEIRGKPAELRCSLRQARARPLLDSLRRWMEKALGSLSTKSETAAAIRYVLSHWRALTRYVDDGLLEIGRVEMWRGSLGLA